MSTSVLSAEQRQRTIGMMVALAACFAAGTDAAGTIASLSPLAGTLTIALSFYALMTFGLRLTPDGYALIRPAVVRFWHAAVLVSVTAAATWIVVLPNVAKSIQTVAAFCPVGVLAALIAGPWHGLLPDSRRNRRAPVLEKDEKE